ncbi:hypothetical protein J4X28_24305, partial [Escherichia coli]
AHQPNRRLRLAAEPQTGRREVSALTDARKTLAYDFFRILRAPLSEKMSKFFLVIGIFVVGRTSASGHNCWHVQKNRCGD